MIYWMYHDEICVPHIVANHKAQDNAEDDVMKNTMGLFVQLYVLGQKYQMGDLRNDSIDAILCAKRITSFGIIPYAYRNTPDMSPLREVLVRMAVYHLTAKDFAKLKGTPPALCSEFLYDTAMMLFANRGLPDPEHPEWEFCKNFHVHDGGSEVAACEMPKAYATEEDTNGQV